MSTNAIDALPAKLRASPNFALSFSAEGECYVAGECEPYAQYWLTERERLAFALFGKRGGLAVDRGIETLAALDKGTVAARQQIAGTLRDMHAAGVLIDPAAELSRYDRAMARDYLDHRAFPRAIAELIAREAGIDRETPVLDLAAGPGNLALELARCSDRVTMMELSRGFVTAARDEAATRGLKLDTINENCNRLVQHDRRYRAITISQALHWLDDIAVAKGVARCLDEHGSFFVVHAALSLPDVHPLSYLLGRNTPLGDKDNQSIGEEAAALFGRLQLLFAALDTSAVARHDPGHVRHGMTPIGGHAISLFRQDREIGAGFARAFLSDSHIAALGMEREQFWADIDARCAAATPAELIGTQEFALLHFCRGAVGVDVASAKVLPVTPI